MFFHTPFGINTGQDQFVQFTLYVVTEVYLVTPAGHIIRGISCGGPSAAQSPCTAGRASWPRAPSASTARSGRASTPPTPPASCRRPCTRCRQRPVKNQGILILIHIFSHYGRTHLQLSGKFCMGSMQLELLSKLSREAYVQTLQTVADLLT